MKNKWNLIAGVILLIMVIVISLFIILKQNINDSSQNPYNNIQQNVVVEIPTPNSDNTDINGTVNTYEIEEDIIKSISVNNKKYNRDKTVHFYESGKNVSEKDFIEILEQNKNLNVKLVLSANDNFSVIILEK